MWNFRWSRRVKISPLHFINQCRWSLHFHFDEKKCEFSFSAFLCLLLYRKLFSQLQNELFQVLQEDFGSYALTLRNVIGENIMHFTVVKSEAPSETSVGLIVGIVIGSLAALILIIVTVVCIARRSPISSKCFASSASPSGKKIIVSSTWSFCFSECNNFKYNAKLQLNENTLESKNVSSFIFVILRIIIKLSLFCNRKKTRQRCCEWAPLCCL